MDSIQHPIHGAVSGILYAKTPETYKKNASSSKILIKIKLTEEPPNPPKGDFLTAIG